MWPGGEHGAFVGRTAEVATLRRVVDGAVSTGRGRAILVGGEPGIGKSALLAYALRVDGVELGWAEADELSTRLPLRVILDGLDIEPRSGDPRRAALAAYVAGQAPVPAGIDPLLALVERVLAFVAQLCTARPLVLVTGGLQWADELSLLVWCRLAELTTRLPLVLVGAYRAVPRRPELGQLRQAVERADGLTLAVGPLPTDDVTALVAHLVGGTPGPHLAELVGRAAGNPLYVRETVDALRYESAVTVRDGTAEIPASLVAPASLAAAVDRRLGFLSPATATVLRAATLLGPEFAVTDLATVLGRPASTLVEPLAEATAAGVVVPAGTRLAFRHPLTRQALYGAMPASVRAGLHRHAAQALDGTGAPPERVAAHLALGPVDGDAWVTGWLVRHAGALSDRGPRVAYPLLERALARMEPDDPAWEALAVAQVRILYRLGYDAEPLAREALATVSDPAGYAELCWVLGALLLRAGRTTETGELVRRGLDRPGVPPVWRARLGAMAAVAQAYVSGESAGTGRQAREALAYARGTGDPMAVAYAYFGLSVVAQVRRDQRARLGHLDRALATLGTGGAEGGGPCPNLRLLVTANRVYALALLDRFGEAEKALARARELVEQGAQGAPDRLHLPAAIVAYCTGCWDEALTEVAAAGSPVGSGLAALVAVHRGTAVPSTVDSAAGGFGLTARALLAERDGQPDRARDILAAILTPRYARLERHMLLPHLVRVALAAGDPDTARAALTAAEADAESVAEADVKADADADVESATEAHTGAHAGAGAVPNPARVAAVAYCRGLLDGDVAALHRAIEHFAAVRRVVDLAQAREELAVVYAGSGDADASRVQAAKAKDGYARLGAVWAVRRVDARLRALGVRLGSRGPRRAGTGCVGWSALSPTEVTIARLVAQGLSNPEIAAELMLSRRTVQSHVSSILAKLHARTRVEIAREAQRHP